MDSMPICSVVGNCSTSSASCRGHEVPGSMVESR